MGLGLYPVLQMYWRAVEAALHRSHLHPIVLPPVVVVVPPARDCCLCGPFLLLSEATLEYLSAMKAYQPE
jgi:hypothetical protein